MKAGLEKARKLGKDSYVIPWEKGINIIRILEIVYQELDSSISFRCACKTGLCGICMLTVNGETKLACKRIVKPNEELVLQPIEKGKHLKSLVVALNNKRPF